MAKKAANMSIGFTVEDSAFKQAMNRVRKDAKNSAEDVASAFGAASKKIEDSLEGVELDALAKEADKASSEAIKSFGKTGEGLQELSDKSKLVSQSITKSFEKVGDDVRAALNQATPFDSMQANADEMGRKLELALEGAKKEAGELSDKLRKAFPKDAPKALERALDQLDDALAETGADGAKSLERIETALREVKGEADKAKSSLGEMRALELGELADKLQGVADGISSVAGNFRAAGEESRKLKMQISAAFADPKEAASMVATIQGLQKEFGHLGFSADDFSLAAKRAATLGLGDLEKNMRRFTAIAAATGKGIDDVTDDFGEFLASFEKGTFDAGVIETIRANFGIGAKALREFGAELDVNGQLLADTSDRARKAQTAIIAYVDSMARFQDVSERTQDSVSKLEAEMAELKRGVGEGSNVMKEWAAKGALPFIQKLNELSPATKAAAGALAEGAGGLAQFAAKGVELGAITALGVNQLRALGVTSLATAKVMAAGAAATAAWTLGITAAVAGAALIAVEFVNMVNAVYDAKEAYDALRDTQKRALEDANISKYVDKNVAAIKAEVSAIEDAGRRRVEITRAIQAKDSEAQNANEQGNKERAAALAVERDELKKVRAEYDARTAAIVKAEQKANQAIVDRHAAAEDAYKKYQQAVQRGEHDSKKDQAKDLDGILPWLTGDAAKQAQSEKKKLNAEILSDEISTLQEIAKAQNLSGKEVKGRLQGLLAQYQSTGDARKKIEKDGADFAKALDKERYDRLRALEEESLALRRSALDLQKSAANATNEEVAALEAKLDKGENVVDQLGEELAKRAESAKKLLDEEAALDRIAIKRAANNKMAMEPDKGNRIKIQEQAAEREKQIADRLAQDKAAIDRQLAKDQEAATKKRADYETAQAQKSLDLAAQKADLDLRAAEQARQAQEATFQQRRKQLDEEAALGRDNRAELTKLDDEIAKSRFAAIKEESALQIDAIKKRADAEKAGKDKSEQELIDRRAALDVERAIMDCKLQAGQVVDQNLALERQQTAELIKQRDALIEQNKERDKANKQGFASTIKGGAQGVEEAFGANSSGWGVSRSKRESEGGGSPSVEDLDREIARRRAKIASEEAGQRRRESKDPTSAPQWGDGAPPPGRRVISDTPETPAGFGEVVAAINALRQTMQQLLGVSQQQSQQMASNNNWQTQDFGRGWGRLPGLS